MCEQIEIVVSMFTFRLYLLVWLFDAYYWKTVKKILLRDILAKSANIYTSDWRPA